MTPERPEITMTEINFLMNKLEQAPLVNMKEANAVLTTARKLLAFCDYHIKLAKEPKEPNV